MKDSLRSFMLRFCFLLLLLFKNFFSICNAMLNSKLKEEENFGQYNCTILSDLKRKHFLNVQ